MQILSFPAYENVLLGIRISDVLKILLADSLPVTIPDDQISPESAFLPMLRDGDRDLAIHDPRRWSLPGIPVPGAPSKLLIIGTTSGHRFGMAVIEMGKVLRVRDEEVQPSQPDHRIPSFLLPGKTTEGRPVLIFDPERFAHTEEFSPAAQQSEPSPQTAHPPSGPKESPTDDLILQVGKTAREIQKILALSDSMIDTMKMVENHLPVTSGALQTVSRMTEEAAHTILGVLETSLDTNQEIRSRLAGISMNPSSLSENVNAINALLMEEEMRIKQGFEAMVFQDLVGQNIRKMTGTLNDLEKKLLEILVEFSPNPSMEEGSQTPKSAVTDPHAVLELKGIPDATTVSQDAVDKLLSEFGF